MRGLTICAVSAALGGCVEPAGIDPDVFGPESSSSSSTGVASTSTDPDTSTGAVESSSSSSESSSSSGADSSTGEPTTCGNGVVDPGELCYRPEPSLIEAGAGAWDVAIVDIDGDGNLDIATLERDAPSLSLRLGDGARGFGEPQTWPVTFQGFRLRAGDCDGDDAPELVVIGQDVTVFDNEGGVLTPVDQNGFGLFPDQLNDAVLVDADINAGLDLVHTTTTSLYFQPGSAMGSAWDFGTGVPIFNVDSDGAAGIASAPWAFDDDEVADLLFLNRNSEYADVLTANGTGGYALLGDAWVCPTGTGAYNATIGDVDGDGNQDLVVSCSTDQFSVVAGLGDGTFAEQVYYDVDGGLRPVILDIDADGDNDVVISSVSDGQLQIWANDGTGVLSMDLALSHGEGGRALELGDLDADGVPEVATAFTAQAGGDFTAVFWSDP